MSYENRITADQLAALEPGDQVIFEVSGGSSWSASTMHKGTVAKLTATQVVVQYPTASGTVGEYRFRRDGGRVVGNRWGELLDPEHPRTATAFARARRERRQCSIDRLADDWRRDRGELDLLRQLQVAISEYLDAES